MKLRNAFLAPTAVLTAITMLAPLAIIMVYSLLTRGAYGGVELPWTLENYSRLYDPVYATIFVRSFWIAAVATALCLLLGFPLAMFIARSGARKNLYLSLVILPFWTSFLIRTYAWMFLLRDTGILNSALQALGIIREPLPLLYNDGAVILGLVYGSLPFMVLPLYTVMRRIDPELTRAASNLGARPWPAFRRVFLPLSLPGIASGSLLVFVLALGFYITPTILGSPRETMISRFIADQIQTRLNWGLGSAMAVILMLLTLVCLLAASRFVRIRDVYGAIGEET